MFKVTKQLAVKSRRQKNFQFDLAIKLDLIKYNRINKLWGILCFSKEKGALKDISKVIGFYIR